jgi:hypothetical protein
MTDAEEHSLSMDPAQTHDGSEDRTSHNFTAAGRHLAPEIFECHGITRLPHPPDSPDLSPADFWRFGYIKGTLEGFFFQDINETRGCRNVSHATANASQSLNPEVCWGKKFIQATRVSPPLGENWVRPRWG